MSDVSEPPNDVNEPPNDVSDMTALIGATAGTAHPGRSRCRQNGRGRAVPWRRNEEL
ncbi:hypothetical protein [Microtetraspora sp. NBRC 16547]|uniref:hypothetical protein n=1 Tax=Microtetraspora sp. NBRC 16547 TaxID=3030993 RepID=UPI0024A2C1D5|nr:hypothetical protein [Microtetraspora sp. NBRC 16547]GLX01281.1 hypothetical protein Misp02_53670 [Microtetraspora sp. NBRC 16547]